MKQKEYLHEAVGQHCSVNFPLYAFPVFAEVKTVNHTIQQKFGGSQSPDDAPNAGIPREQGIKVWTVRPKVLE